METSLQINEFMIIIALFVLAYLFKFMFELTVNICTVLKSFGIESGEYCCYDLPTFGGWHYYSKVLKLDDADIVVYGYWYKENTVGDYPEVYEEPCDDWRNEIKQARETNNLTDKIHARNEESN